MADAPLDRDLTPEEQARQQFLKDTAELMGSHGPERAIRPATFRRWLWHLVEDPGWCAIHAAEAAKMDGAPLHRALGKREMGLQLFQTAAAVGGEQYRQMWVEAANLKLQREMEKHRK